MNSSTLVMPSRIATEVKEAPSAADQLIQQGLRTWEQGRPEEALLLFRRAVGADLRRPEPWYWIGCLKEEGGDKISAAYCYYLAHDIRRYGPAREALKRLGYMRGEDGG